MKSYKELKDIKIGQIKDIINTYAELNNIATEINTRFNSYKINNFITDLRQRAKRFGINMDGLMEIKEANSSEKIFLFKNVLVKKIVELINMLVEYYEENPKNVQIENEVTTLESALGKLGYVLFDLPVGIQYDFNIDTMFAEISNKEHVNISMNKNKNTQMYVSSSTYGCAENKNGVYGKVVEKAEVELTEDLKSIGKKRNIERNK